MHASLDVMLTNTDSHTLSSLSRSSHASKEAIRQLASEARIGGMLSGKVGCTYFHVGRGDAALDALEDVIANSEVPIYNLLATHMSR